MNARDLFDAFGRLPESCRLEALDAPAQDAAEEINALFAENDRRQMQPAQQTKSEQSRSIAVTDVQPPRQQKSANPIRNLTIGLTAVAAVIAVTVGAMVWRVHQETIETIGTTPGASLSSAVTEINIQTDSAGVPVTETTATGDAVPSAQSAEVTQMEPSAEPEETPHTTGTNIFGGNGELKIRGVLNGLSQPILEDDDFWYISGRGRISKTALNSNGHYYEELLCQTPGCLHNTEDCLRYRYMNMLTDGEVLYEQEVDQNGYLNDSDMLIRINPDGSRDVFFWPDKELIRENAGLTADQANAYYSYYNIEYYDIIKLGTSGNYLISGQMFSSVSDNEAVWLNLIYTPATEAAILLPAEARSWQYDAGSNRLYGAQLSTKLIGHFGQDADFFVYDIITGEVVGNSSFQGIVSYAILDGKLYYEQGFDTNEELIVDGKVSGGRINTTYSIKVYDFETEQGQALQENIADSMQLIECGGRLLCSRHARVGKDQLFYLNPEDMSEEVIFETPNTIQFVQSASPDLIWISGNFAGGFIIDGELRHIDFGNF